MLTGFQPVTGHTERKITTRDRLVMKTNDGKQEVLVILMARKTDIVVASALDKPGHYRKVILPFNVASETPVWCGEAKYTLLVPEGANATEAPKVRAARASKGEGASKIQQCRDLFAQNPDLDREAMIKQFIDIAKCTPQGAITYFLTCKKELTTA